MPTKERTKPCEASNSPAAGPAATRPRHLAHGRIGGRRSAEVAAVRARHRHGLPPDRHRRDVRRGRRRRGGRPGRRPGAALRAMCMRQELFIVSKVYPHNASRRARAACDRSRRRLGWSTSICTCCTGAASIRWPKPVDAMESLVADGRIGRWGVSNFDADDMEELAGAAAGRRLRGQPGLLLARPSAASIQPAAVAARARLPLMAYCPIDQGALASERPWRHGAAARRTAAQSRWPGCWRRGRGRHSEGGARGAPARQPAPRPLRLGRDDLPRSTACFHRHPARAAGGDLRIRAESGPSARGMGARCY